MSLDRLRRSMSLETCRVDKDSTDAVVERQTSSLKCRINPPETIPEEEIERIRRESLVPRVGLLAGTGRRRSSVAVESNSIANSFVKTVMGRGSNAGVEPWSMSSSTEAVPKPASATATDGGAVSSPELQKLDGLDRKDEGLGESFDHNSELSDSNSRTGVAVNVVELHTIGHRSPVKAPITGTRSLTCNTRLNGVKDAGDEEFDGLTFTAPAFADEDDGSGVDPLCFLTEEQAKRVTFM